MLVIATDTIAANIFVFTAPLATGEVNELVTPVTLARALHHQDHKAAMRIITAMIRMRPDIEVDDHTALVVNITPAMIGWSAYAVEVTPTPVVPSGIVVH